MDRELLGHLGKLLNEEISVDDFRHWFANALWDIEGDSDDVTLALAYRIENRIAEIARGAVNEDQFRQAVQRDLSPRATISAMSGMHR